MVEQSRDLLAMEKAGTYQGVYHVLLGRLAPLQGMGPEQLTVDALEARVRSGTVRELIMATNPNLEGDGTALSSPTGCTTPACRSPDWPAGWPRAARSNSPTGRCSPTPSRAASDSDQLVRLSVRDSDDSGLVGTNRCAFFAAPRRLRLMSAPIVA